MPQGGAQAGDGDFRGVQAVAHVSIRGGKAVGLLGWVSFLSVCGSLYFLAANLWAIRQRV